MFCRLCCGANSRKPSINCTRATVPEPRKRRVSVPVAKANFRRELRDFFGFILHPRFAPRLPGRLADSGWRSDWFSGAPLGRLLKWAAFLGRLNLVVLAPIA